MKVIEGYGVKYNTVINDGKLNMVVPDALDTSMVQFWVDHKSQLKLGDTRTNLELYTDDYGLAFRLRLDDSELAERACALVKNKQKTECSIGFDLAKTVTREIDGKSIIVILQARLEEISLVFSGAMSDSPTHAMVNDIEKCGSLADDCKSMKFRSDNSFAELQRKLRRAMG
jgi:HK97 family phage prohead protease